MTEETWVYFVDSAKDFWSWWTRLLVWCFRLPVCSRIKKWISINICWRQALQVKMNLPWRMPFICMCTYVQTCIFLRPQRELEYMRVYMLELVQQIVPHSCLLRYAACRLWICHVIGSGRGLCVKLLLHPPISYSVEPVSPLHPLPVISVDHKKWKFFFILYIYSTVRNRGLLNIGSYCIL